MALGGMTVSELLARVSSRELTEWMAFYKLEPFGAAEDEYHTAMVVSMVANTARDEEKRKNPFVPEEFMRESMRPEADEEDEGLELMRKAMTVFGIPLSTLPVNGPLPNPPLKGRGKTLTPDPSPGRRGEKVPLVPRKRTAPGHPPTPVNGGGKRSPRTSPRPSPKGEGERPPLSPRAGKGDE